MAKRAFPSEQESYQHPLYITHNAPDTEEPPEKQPRASADDDHASEQHGVLMEDIRTAANRAQEETTEIFLKWREELSAAENFELLCPSKLDEILKEAYALESSLIEQKEKQKDALKSLSKTLGIIA